ncbi:hypothetical protein [Listeria booriae]|uniref:hypothetical protein n=1 Tax=Listeria booriae TaxID=1552123 RepID=UPI001627B4C2|nr:hypothetical protein [Listeria booriae]MBC2164945.1 hypothetical protein [Listeria booriae]
MTIENEVQTVSQGLDKAEQQSQIPDFVPFLNHDIADKEIGSAVVEKTYVESLDKNGNIVFRETGSKVLVMNDDFTSSNVFVENLVQHHTDEETEGFNPFSLESTAVRAKTKFTGEDVAVKTSKVIENRGNIRKEYSVEAVPKDFASAYIAKQHASLEPNKPQSLTAEERAVQAHQQMITQVYQQHLENQLNPTTDKNILLEGLRSGMFTMDELHRQYPEARI